MEVPETAHVWRFYSASRVHDPGPALAVQRVGRNDERGWWDGGSRRGGERGREDVSLSRQSVCGRMKTRGWGR